ncbi:MULTISPECIES: sigma-70 family RNA polymerase sigma factor [Streptomyces]|uniref:DNA-directed RNA polymerase sigma-70 factor n=2 Tax=Streptomyces TaxID=1883 RepID=A0A918Y5A7_9ACTN|nr:MULTISPECIES: sigma-70 family RNA polymerase sigma factor [Streptomyces]WNB98803.1 sigma-70 family RNA polymerase sigma factor [Streptomyces sp. CGMCC 4.7035]SPE99964.1 Sigma-24 [Streptomyces sp. MA5143a]GHD91115.1 DNA-directed RNA polymerase sigma-70 factor [Streptomyces naganishii JCM 4654]GHF01202.1 DNA-directed RNA polymerase sigma-70 factor [Streptomyces griseoluteus]GHJ99613.1 DNA-directed RNA polymerase sigma-70 factor [Streptomyces sp. Y2F8-2]
MIERTASPRLGCDLPDRLLAVRAAEGDEDSFAVLVQRHSRSLLTLARCMLGNPQDAEEAVQDAFVSAWRHLPEYRHRAEFHTWMYRITVNRCQTMCHRRPPPLSLDTVAEPAAGDAWSQPARTAEEDAAMAALFRALAELDAGQRVCWILREVQGLPYKEIAHVTRTDEQTVRGRLFRARRSLQEAMGSWR